MTTGLQINWASAPNRFGDSPPSRLSHAQFGSRNDHKAIKAMIGIALLIGLSVLLYVLNA